MHGQDDDGKRRARHALLLAVFLILLALWNQPAALRVKLDEARMSFQMKLAFVEMTFDFGQSRSKSNSLVVIL